MYLKTQDSKQNRHPNKTIIEEDITKISKQYVLEGDRLKVKSFLHKEKPMNIPKPQDKNSEMNQLKKLEYLLKNGVINEDEKVELKILRKKLGINPSESRVRIPFQQIKPTYDYPQNSRMRKPNQLMMPQENQYEMYPQDLCNNSYESDEEVYEPNQHPNYYGKY